MAQIIRTYLGHYATTLKQGISNYCNWQGHSVGQEIILPVNVFGQFKNIINNNIAALKHLFSPHICISYTSCNVLIT